MAVKPLVYDVAIIGGGPAGLAASIACAQAGLAVVVLEKRGDDLDKACGEGLLPPALEALEALGVSRHLSSVESAPFRTLRYVLEDGSAAEARLPGAGGLGVRRPVLVAALRKRADELSVDRREGSAAGGFARDGEGVSIAVDPPIRCGLLVGADGLGSEVRKQAGLERPVRPGGRYGLRQHFRVTPWSPAVEVYFGPGVEAYVTPVGPETVGVAFLWSLGELPPRMNARALLARLPQLERRFGSAPEVTRARGAGPLERRVRARTADRVALIGDAAGYLDAITGEGLALAFRAALRLGEVVPRALGQGASKAALVGYERTYAAAYARYVRLTRLVLALSARAAVRKRVVRWLAAHPRAFDSLIAWGLTSAL